MARPGLRLVGIFSALCLSLVSCSRGSEPLPDYRELIQRLSEEGGYFDTDNLISNETAYAQVIDRLEPMGGVYVGVGPEQNFHYIGRIRPTWAFIVDIRRDNMLHHLMLNAILAQSELPYDYLCLLFSRPCEAEPASGEFSEILGAFEMSRPEAELFEANKASILAHIERGLGLSLTAEEADVVERIYRAFFDEQLGLRFRSHGRAPMPYHPSYRGLLRAEGEEGFAHFLSRPDDYAHVRGLAIEGRLVPVVGDFAGSHALRAVGAFVEELDETVSLFYVSNVEFYLMRGGEFADYVGNVRSLPVSETSQFVRAYFSYGYPHPEAMPGHRSTLVRQRISEFLRLYEAGAYRNYWDVSTLDYEP